ncbi:ammonium transporter (TC 1.A.11) [Alteromonadaceae bacterium Bs31]|nr:ammonium transporter (TC 1.A.11) [Alteromonadaceae bacterium Bs31]
MQLLCKTLFVHPKLFTFLTICLSTLSLPALAQDNTGIEKEAIDVIWLATASALVFLMQAGFALLESGMSRAKNCINVVMKNYLDLCLGSLVFFLVGYGLMFGINDSGWFGTSHFAMYKVASWDYSFLLFQTMFAATAVTIASGAMAERTLFRGYLWGAVVITGLIYPVFGSWAWGSFYQGSGWLAELGFIDFAGSSVVHSVGGWCALAAIMVLGPRLGRFSNKGEVRDIPGHNLNFVALGGLILWFGWFGFNGGSTTSADVSIGLINLNTQLAAASGAVGALIAGKLYGNRTLVTSIINGSLAGLVGITAGCSSMEPIFAIVTGLSAGIIAYAADCTMRKMRLDDVVGAVSVHGVAGAWGTLCAGLFFAEDMFNPAIIMVQLIGIIACFIWTFGTAFVTFTFIHKLGKLRVSSIDEQRGLDFAEHSEIAYPEFSFKTAYSKDALDAINKQR